MARRSVRAWTGAGLALIIIVIGGVTWTAPRARVSITILNPVAVGSSPLAVAVDAQRGHAFVLSDVPADPSAVRVSMIDTATGAFLHGISGAFFPRALTVDARSAHAFVVAADGAVRVLDTRTGNLLRTIVVSGSPAVDTAPVVDARSEHVFVPGEAGVEMLDARSGRALRVIPLGMQVQGLAIDARHGRVVVTGYNAMSGAGLVRLLDAASGRVQRTIALDGSPSPGATLIDERAGRAFVVDRIVDSLSVVDTGSGRLAQTGTTCANPHAMVLDAQAGRLFVTSDSGGGAGRVSRRCSYRTARTDHRYRRDPRRHRRGRAGRACHRLHGFSSWQCPRQRERCIDP